MWSLLPEVIALPMLPLLRWQGKRIRKRTPRLPEAAGERNGTILPAEIVHKNTLHIIAIGESPIAGVGVATQEQAVTAQCAVALAELRQQPVQWQTFSRNGATVADALETVCPAMPEIAADIVLIGFGVNDTTAFRRPDAYRHDLLRMTEVCRQKFSPTWIVITGVPPMQSFPALSWPLRSILGLKARVLDQVVSALANEYKDVLHIPFELDPNAPGMMASDGYHPSAAGATAWGSAVAQVIHRVLEKA